MLDTFRVSPMPNFATELVNPVWTPERADLSNDQVQVFDKVMSWFHDPNARQYLKLGGYAGTGKTTLTACLAHEFEREGKSIAYCAFTGKAVNVLGRKLREAGLDLSFCSTLHSLIYQPKIDNNGNVTGWERKPELPVSMIVVDEASMVGTELWQDLVSYGLPILAVGDHGQLPPVGDQVINLMTDPDLRLERIHRQAEGNPILALAQWVREGKPLRGFEPTDARVSFISAFAEVSSKVASDPNNFVAICYTNRTRCALNRFVRQAMSADNKLSGPMRDNFPKVGDTVICLRNKKPIFNGMRGKLMALDLSPDKWSNAGSMIDFEDDKLRMQGKLFTNQFGNPKTIDKLADVISTEGETPNGWNQLGMMFDYGYALTAHKAQGSQFRNVCMIYENLFRDNDTRKRWLYTACTRASDTLYMVRT